MIWFLAGLATSVWGVWTVLQSSRDRWRSVVGLLIALSAAGNISISAYKRWGVGRTTVVVCDRNTCTTVTR